MTETDAGGRAQALAPRNGNDDGGRAAELSAAARAGAYGGQHRGRPEDGARLATFAAQFRHQPVILAGKSLTELDGYASVVEQRYPMWDMFGEYGETMDAKAFDGTLARNPDVAFLVNHRGLSMARTIGGTPTLFLDADPRGLHMRALLNQARTDVSDLLISIDDEVVTEMSFAFMILEWEWNEEYTECRIMEVDLDRGDVSAVNFGANPYTSISARTQEIMGLLPHLPESTARAVMSRLGERLGVPGATVDRLTSAAAVARSAQPDDVTDHLHTGRSVSMVERLLDLDS